MVAQPEWTTAMTRRAVRARFDTRIAIYLLCNLLAMAIGAIVVQFGGQEGDGDSVLTGTGLSIIAAGVTGLVMIGYIIVTDTVRNQIIVLQNFGIRDYFDSNTTAIRGEYAARLNGRNRQIDVLGLGLSHLRQDFGRQLESWATYGTVRILLIDPSFPSDEFTLAAQRDMEEREPPGSIRGEVSEWLTETRQLRRDHPKTFQVRLYRCTPTITMVRVGKEAFWSPYLMHRRSSSTPTMLVHQGGLLFDVVTDHFEEIWSSDRLSRDADLEATSDPASRGSLD
jgi:hypothetical protein